MLQQLNKESAFSGPAASFENPINLDKVGSAVGMLQQGCGMWIRDACLIPAQALHRLFKYCVPSSSLPIALLLAPAGTHFIAL